MPTPLSSSPCRPAVTNSIGPGLAPRITRTGMREGSGVASRDTGRKRSRTSPGCTSMPPMSSGPQLVGCWFIAPSRGGAASPLLGVLDALLQRRRGAELVQHHVHLRQQSIRLFQIVRVGLPVVVFFVLAEHAGGLAHLALDADADQDRLPMSALELDVHAGTRGAALERRDRRLGPLRVHLRG